MSYLALDQLPDPTDKFQLDEELGTGFAGRVYKAKDLQSGNWVAIKIQPYDEEHRDHIEEEYRVLRDHASYPNIPDFYGVYRQKHSNNAPDDIWFILQYCNAGTVVQLVNNLLKQDKRMKEEHIAFILREVAKAAIELHRNHNIHRDIRGSNILLTKEGEVKLCDFGLTREVDSTFGKRGTCIGSPCWMAPELVTSLDAKTNEVYTSRIDVWALGITAIELADGKPPFADMHPTRALFQIVRNPPPTPFKPSNWSQNFNDFIAECLEKNPENRPCMIEIIEHPFLTELVENEYALQQEVKSLIESTESEVYKMPKEVCVDRGYMKCVDHAPEKLYSEDLAAIENPVDGIVLEHLKNRLQRGSSYSFIGDILLSLNSNDLPKEYDKEFHEKYKFKSRSENSPHIFSVADLAYQDMMHHKVPQHVIFSGESYSGKTTNFRLFTKHIFHLGGGNRGATDKVEKAINALFMLTHAGTPLNNDSSRCLMQYTFTFGNTGKLSGAIFRMFLLEKMRVSTTDMNQHNFHIFYYLYDFLAANNLLSEFHLNEGRNYRYLRVPPELQPTKLKYVRDDIEENAKKYKEFEDCLTEINFTRKEMDMIRKILGAILNIGDLRFKQSDKRTAELEDPDYAIKAAELLRVDEKKFQWALCNYCKVMGGIAERRKYSPEEARDARDCLGATLYNRLIDWIINKINLNLSFPRSVFGDGYSIVAYDMFGFECFHRNGLEQLIINTVNEKIQFLYNQKIFASEMFEMEADGVPPVQLNFYDNKQTLDHLLTKPEGLFYMIDDATRQRHDSAHFTDRVSDKRSQFVKKVNDNEISVAHYTGKIIYDVRAFSDVNRDFVPAETVEAVRTSLEEAIVLMFTNQLSKCGNLTLAFDNIRHKDNEGAKRKTYVMNTLSMGQYNQITQPRTLSAVFRATCLELLKILTGDTEKGGSHFVRCIRADLEYKPRNFHSEMVQQQMKALGVIDTIIARQQGYSCRITFHEFLKRYQFLAFDFDETVDITKDNCRLLLIRLKMEGWAIGKSKVFLRYYNDEFLSRLYEIQVKKIIKVQSMMRSYIARRKMQNKNNPVAATNKLGRQGTGDPSAAATTIQKAYRGFKVRQKYGPLLNEKTGEIDQTTAVFVKTYAKRWRAKSLFQVLLHYRAAKYLDLVNLSQQVHIYNQRFVSMLQPISKGVQLDKVNVKQVNSSHLGPLPLPCRKLPFRLSDIPFYDTSYMCDPISGLTSSVAALKGKEDDEPWDSPLQRNPSLTNYLMTYNAYKKEQACQTNWERMYESDVVYQQSYFRDPNLMKRSAMMRKQNELYMSDPSSANMQSYANMHPYENGFPSEYNQGGSRRNSLYKKRMAPTPPPTPGPAMMRNDASWSNRTSNRETTIRNDFRPSNPVRELEMLGRRAGVDNEMGDEPPFNFKAMLRKTNYSRPENNNYEYNSRPTESNPSFAPKLKPTGFNREDANSNINQRNMNQTSTSTMPTTKNPSDSNAALSTGTYVEEEIAPGVTLSGYAYNI